MNIVFFVESYYHKPFINGICVKKIADSLVNAGHSVTVFTSSENVYDLPCKEIVEGVRVFRIRRDLRTFLRLYLNAHKEKPHVFLKLMNKIYSLWVHMIHSRSWPLKSVFTPLRYYMCARKYCKGQKIDVIVGTYQHIEEVLAAILLKKKYQNAKLITYTLDAMTGRITPKIRGKEEFARRSIAKWEKYVYAQSDKICVMESHRKHYETGKYSDETLRKIRYVDVPLLDLSGGTSTQKNASGKLKRIVYTGVSTRLSGSARYFVKLMPYIQNAEFHLYGAIDEEIQLAIDESRLENIRIFFHGYIDHGQVEKVLAEADFLVTFGSQNACMVSGKVFEYMATGKPIIAFYQIDEDVNIINLAKYPYALIIKENDKDYSVVAQELTEFLDRIDFNRIDKTYLREVFFQSTPEAMVQEILN